MENGKNFSMDKEYIDLVNLKQYMLFGKSREEIIQIMKVSESYITQLIDESVKNGTWFTEEELKIVDKNKKINEIILKAKSEKEIEKNQENIPNKTIKSNEKDEEEKTDQNNQESIKITKRKIDIYTELYKKYKIIAKKEDKLDGECERNVPTEGRKKFINVLKELQKLDVNIRNEDIQIILNYYYLYPSMADKEGIQFLLLDANKKGGISLTKKIGKELCSALKKTKFYEPLFKYTSWLGKKEFLPKILEYKRKKMSNTEIAEKIGMTSAEVSIILNSEDEKEFNKLSYMLKQQDELSIK